MSSADQCPQIIVDGVVRKLGITKASLQTSMPLYADSGPVWTKDQILQAINDPARVAAEVRYGDEWVKDQDGVGACAGYAAASAVERARESRGLAFVELSGDGAYAAVNDGVDRGSGLEENMVNIRDNGIPPASLVTRWEYRKNRINPQAYVEAKRFKGFECFAIRTEMQLASALAAGFVTVVAVHAGNGGRSADGLIDWSNGVGNHSVVVDDIRYRNGTFEFQTANSWGLNWGNRGRGWLSWSRHLSTPIRYHQFYALRSTVDDSQGDNPPPIRE